MDKNQKRVAPRRFWFPQTVCNLLFWGGTEYSRLDMGSRTTQKGVRAKSRRRSHRVVGVFISVFSSAMSGKIAETAFRVHAIGHLVETKSWVPKVVLCLGEMALASLVLTLFCGDTRISKRRNRSGRLLWCARTFFVRGGPKILDKNQKHVAPRRFWFSQTVCNLLSWGGTEYSRVNMGSRASQKCVCAKSRKRSHRVVGVLISVRWRDVWEDCGNRIQGPRNRTPGRNQKLGAKCRSLPWGDGIS